MLNKTLFEVVVRNYENGNYCGVKGAKRRKGKIDIGASVINKRSFLQSRIEQKKNKKKCCSS